MLLNLYLIKGNFILKFFFHFIFNLFLIFFDLQLFNTNVKHKYKTKIFSNNSIILNIYYDLLILLFFTIN